jgi:hypothetical protein
MAASHLQNFKPSSVDVGELLVLVEKYLLPSCVVIQWKPAKGEDIPTPNTKEIVVLTSFFQCGFGLLMRFGTMGSMPTRLREKE